MGVADAVLCSGRRYDAQPQKADFICCLVREMKIVNHCLIIRMNKYKQDVSQRFEKTCGVFHQKTPRCISGYVGLIMKSEAKDAFKGPKIGSKSDRLTVFTDRHSCSACLLKTSSAGESPVKINMLAHWFFAWNAA
jgi:hypothetical protein